MSISRFLAIGAVGGALAATVLAPASAAAKACPEEASIMSKLCFNEPLEMVEGTFKLHVNNDPTTPTKEFVIKGSEVEVKCPEILLRTDALMTTSTKAPGVSFSNIVLHFIRCSAPAPEHCVVNGSLILSTTLSGRGPTPAENNLLLVFPTTGTIFAAIKLESSGGTCLIAGNNTVTSLRGHEKEGPLCKAPGAATTTILHLVECTGTTKLTNLKFVGKEVEFKGNISALLAGQTTKWAVVLGE
jgi:hypothetical protein